MVHKVWGLDIESDLVVECINAISAITNCKLRPLPAYVLFEKQKNIMDLALENNCQNSISSYCLYEISQIHEDTYKELTQDMLEGLVDVLTDLYK